jgi:SAM-dependent methyltransferase
MEETLKKISDLYTDNVSRLGQTSAAVGWSTPASQELRFDKLTSVIDASDTELTINDYGCGYGAHLEYLLKHRFPVASYNGYDISSKMLSYASRNLDQRTCSINLFESKTISTIADYSFASGTFNVRFESEDTAWMEYIMESLDQLNRFSVKGFSFNLLTKYVDYREPHLFYGDPLFWFDHCKNRYSRFVSLLHDYNLYEWTITVRKNAK